MQTGGRHYALLPNGRLASMAVVDLTDPLHPSNPLLPHLRLDLGGGGDGYATYVGQGDDGAHPGHSGTSRGQATTRRICPTTGRAPCGWAGPSCLM